MIVVVIQTQNALDVTLIQNAAHENFFFSFSAT
jgi:hypothetical protein